jgi:signal transduction histidine kinase
MADASVSRKRLFLALRYLYIVTAACLVVSQAQLRTIHWSHVLMIGIALTSNVFLCFVTPQKLFAWYVEAPILVADTLWVSWALNSSGAVGAEFFLLYFFVLTLATFGENIGVVVAGSTITSAMNVYLVWDSELRTVLLFRVVFFYFVALFYGTVLTQIRRERQRADRGLAWVRELELQVAERTAELQRLYDQSMAANRAKSEFVANMSHELRTPLNIIIGYVEMLQDGKRKPEATPEILGRIRESATGLLSLVQTVLDLGKLDSGKEPVTNTPIQLDSFLHDLERRDRVPLHAGVRLEWQLAGNLPVIETDGAKLCIVLDNLINNAIKFTDAGLIAVSAQLLLEADEIEFRVRDSGPGIEETHLRRIFEPFTQLPGAGDVPFGGVGLGLAIVQRHLALLGGNIRVESTVGVGTTFIVTVPVRPRRTVLLDQAA